MIAAGIFFLYAVVKKPDLVAVLLFTLVVSDINFNLPGGLPLRTTITLILFMRIYGEQSKLDYPGFFSNSLTWHMIFFIIYMCLVSMMNGLLDMALFKEFLLCFISSYLAYYYYFKSKGHAILKKAMILGGLICLADLGYTYAFNGGFPVIRVFYQFVPEAFAFNNHNFFGYICGTCFVFLLSDYLTARAANKYTLLFMPAMFLGVLLSTSRGALIAMIIMTVFLLGKGLLSKTKGKRASRILAITVVCVVLATFILPIATDVLGIKSEFLETLTKRLVDEPLAMVNKMMGNSYKAESMETVEWREEASNLAYNYYKNLPSNDQALGIGYGGFLARDVGHGYDAHNGILLIFIELGFVGFLIYFSLVVSFWSKVRKWKISSPAFNSIVFIIL
ncbi:MAG TPA: O-antigen ligase family protein, partial [Chitinophagaceae bacterium]|nr:O-antigen ligase family protein [Chitinophagaceae bacterium]